MKSQNHPILTINVIIDGLSPHHWKSQHVKAANAARSKKARKLGKV